MKIKSCLRDYANKYDKEMLYDYYYQLIKWYSKDYDSITRKKMVDAIIEKLSPEFILSICTCRELRFLETLLNGDEEIIRDIEKNKNDYEFEIHALERKCLTLGCDIWEEFEEPIQEALKMVDWDKKEQEDNKVIFLLGYLRSVTIVETFVMENLASYICDGNREEAIEIFKSNHLFQYYVNFYTEFLTEEGEEVPVFIYSEYLEYANRIYNQREKYEYVPEKILSENSYRSIFYNGYDETNKTVNDFFENLKKISPSYSIHKFELLTMMRFLDLDDEDDLHHLKPSSSKDWKIVRRLLPSAVLRGMSIEDYEQEKENYAKIKQLNCLNVPQKNARLLDKDAKTFLKYYCSILDFVNSKYKIHPNLRFAQGGLVYEDKALEVSSVLWENKEALLDEYCKLNPLKLTKRALNIVHSFRQGFRKELILYRYEEKYAAFMDEENVYMIKGLFENMDQMIPVENLPLKLEAALLPFGSDIVSDGVITFLPMSLELKEIEKLEENYQNNPKVYSYEVLRYHP